MSKPKKRGRKNEEDEDEDETELQDETVSSLKNDQPASKRKKINKSEDELEEPSADKDDAGQYLDSLNFCFLFKYNLI